MGTRYLIHSSVWWCQKYCEVIYRSANLIGITTWDTAQKAAACPWERRALAGVLGLLLSFSYICRCSFRCAKCGGSWLRILCSWSSTYTWIPLWFFSGSHGVCPWEPIPVLSKHMHSHAGAWEREIIFWRPFAFSFSCHTCEGRCPVTSILCHFQIWLTEIKQL